MPQDTILKTKDININLESYSVGLIICLFRKFHLEDPQLKSRTLRGITNFHKDEWIFHYIYIFCVSMNSIRITEFVHNPEFIEFIRKWYKVSIRIQVIISFIKKISCFFNRILLYFVSPLCLFFFFSFFWPRCDHFMRLNVCVTCNELGCCLSRWYCRQIHTANFCFFAEAKRKEKRKKNETQ